MIRKLKVDKPMNLSNQIAETLIQAILEGDLKSGEQLVETELQALFSISRSPLREAFREMEKKGLVDIVPRKGTFVKQITKADIKKQFPVRAALESLAAKLAFINNRKAAATRLSQALEDMAAAVEAKDPKNYYIHHIKYHQGFIDLSDNELLIEMLHNLRMKNLWYTLHYQYYMEDLNMSLKVHQKIVELFQDPQTDPESLRNLVEYHINIALDKFIEYLKKLEKTEKDKNSAKSII
jgi:DNA-binding GntR family transcriptional regulator